MKKTAAAVTREPLRIHVSNGCNCQKEPGWVETLLRARRPTKILPNEHLEIYSSVTPRGHGDLPSLKDGISKRAALVQALIQKRMRSLKQMPKCEGQPLSLSLKQPLLASQNERSDDRTMNPHRPNFRFVWSQISFLAPMPLVPFFFFSRGAAWEEEKMLEIGSLSDTSFLHPISGRLVSRFATMTPILPRDSVCTKSSPITHARSLV